MAFNVNNLQYAEDTMIGFNFTGGTKVQAVIGITDSSLGYSKDTQEVQSIDENFSKLFVATSDSWTLSTTFQMRNQTGSTAIDQAKYSGDTNLLIGNNRTISGLDLFEHAKNKALVVYVVIKLRSGNYQKGYAIITNFNIDMAVNSITTGSIELQGVGKLLKSLT